MDMISEVVSALHAGRPSPSRVSRSGEWGMRLPGIAGMGFHVVLDGGGWLIATSGEPVRLATGDVVLVPYGTEHGLSHAPVPRIGDLPVLQPSRVPIDDGSPHIDVILGCYRLEHGRAHRFVRDLPPVIAMSPDYGSHPELRALIEMLTVDVSQDPPGPAMTRAALVDLMLVHALRHGWRQARSDELPTVADSGIAAALDQIHTNPQQPWTLQRLGGIAGMSRTVFKRQFTATVGKPPITYLLDWRLTRAARLLRETTAPLAVIARQVGYSSEYAFGNAFRRKFGVAPGRFRDRLNHALEPGRGPVLPGSGR